MALQSWTSTLMFSEQSKNHHETKYTQAYVPTHGIPTQLLYHPNCPTSNEYFFRTLPLESSLSTTCGFVRELFSSIFLRGLCFFLQVPYLCFFCPLQVGDCAEKITLGNATVGLQ